MNTEAMEHFETAIRLGGLEESDLNFYPTLARLYHQMNDTPRYRHYMEQKIDLEWAKIQTNSSPTREQVESLFDLRRDYTNRTKKFGGYQFIFSDSYQNNDYMVQYQNEINYQIRRFTRFRPELYFQTIATLTSSFSGNYFDTFSGTTRNWVGQSTLGDGINLVAGARVYPFRGKGLYAAFDHVFSIGRLTEHDNRFHIGYFGAIGNDLEPVVTNWLFGSLWGDAIYSLRNEDFTVRSEARLGRSFRMDKIDRRFVVTPFVGVTGVYGGKNVSRSERLGAEAGPGIIFRKYFDEDKYRAPRQSLDFVVQYKIGLTHKRQNVLSFMLFHSF